MSDSLENVRNKRVHNGHSLGGNTGVRVNLFQDFVDVDRERLLAFSLAFFLVSGWGSLLDNSFLRSFGSGHFEKIDFSK